MTFYQSAAKSHKGQKFVLYLFWLLTLSPIFTTLKMSQMMIMIQASILLFYHVCFISALKLPPTPHV